MPAGPRAIPALTQITILALVAWIELLVPHSAAANSTGIGGYSGKRGAAFTCNACHGGGVVPNVRFEGPTQVETGSTNMFRFVVKSNDADQDKAGFNVAVGESETNTFAGLLTPSDGARNVGPGFRQCPTSMPACELTHEFPLAVDDNEEAAWDFMWQAPPEPGMYIFYGSGNSVNQQQLGTTGDRSASTTFNVEVVVAPPTEIATATEMPTGTPTPTATPAMTATSPPASPTSGVATATPTGPVIATPTRQATNTRRPTPTGPRPCAGDCNGDGNVSTAELVVAVGIALDNVAIDRCQNADRDLDGKVLVNELMEAVNAAVEGCL